MSIFRLQIGTIGRSVGRSATAAAAYRAGERIRDQRTNSVHDYSRRKDVIHAEIMLPSRLDAAAVEWARDRSSLWNAAEHAENRKNSRVAREIQVGLPPELSASQRLDLARRFSQDVADRYNVAVDLAIHNPPADGDPRNFHAHLLATTREVSASGLGARTGLDLRPEERERLGLASHVQEYRNIRERWAEFTNEALREAAIDVRIDHRTLAAQGIDREPRPFIPVSAMRMERSGVRSEQAERIRAEHSARVQARLERKALASRVEQLSAGSSMNSASAPQADAPRSLEDLRRQARENWLQMRSSAGDKTSVKQPISTFHRDENPAQKREMPTLNDVRDERGNDNDHST
jgi:hypothetical protein